MQTLYFIRVCVFGNSGEQDFSGDDGWSEGAADGWMGKVMLEDNNKCCQWAMNHLNDRLWFMGSEWVWYISVGYPWISHFWTNPARLGALILPGTSTAFAGATGGRRKPRPSRWVSVKVLGPRSWPISIYFYGVSAATFHPSVWIATFWCFPTAEWISHRLQRVRRPQSQTESLSALCESHQAVQTHLEAHETQLWEGHGFEHGDAAESQLFFWMLICGWS